jgi:hypothetical protein
MKKLIEGIKALAYILWEMRDPEGRAIFREIRAELKAERAKQKK